MPKFNSLPLSLFLIYALVLSKAQSSVTDESFNEVTTIKPLHNPTYTRKLKGGQKQDIFDKDGKLIELPKTLESFVQTLESPKDVAATATPSSLPDSKALPDRNCLSQLPQLAREKMIDLLFNDPQGTLSLMEVSHGFRSLALDLNHRTKLVVPNNLRKKLLMILIGGHTGNLTLFIKNHYATFQDLNIAELTECYTSRHHHGILSLKTNRGKIYSWQNTNWFTTNRDSQCVLNFCYERWRFAPIHFSGVEQVQLFAFRGNGLRAPPMLSGLTNLEILYLDENLLVVPPVVTRLSRLQYLGLSQNELRIPPVVTGLMNLIAIDLSKNKLERSPDVIGLTNLRGIYLAENQLVMPPNLIGLRNLRCLDLRGNQLETLPNLAGLINLQRVDFSCNKLSILPVVSGLINLVDLNLQINQLSEAPDVSGLKNIKCLHLSDNQMKIPPVVTGLVNLIELDLENNLLTKSPVLRGLLNLRELYLFNNLLSEPPDLIGLTNLRNLSLRRNPLIAHPVVTELTSLEWFDLARD